MSANSSANRLGLDYRIEATRLGPPPRPILDIHTHVNGPRAARIFREVMSLYGVEKVYSMTAFDEIPAVQEALGDQIEFIAVPNYRSPDRKKAFTTEWLELIEKFAEAGSKICKFWSAPRAREYAEEVGQPELFALNSPPRRHAMQIARDCGMFFMTHIADPDTWFATKYSDAKRYGTKREQYEPLEAALAEFSDVPWIAAHLGGWPEDLEFLDGLLQRHTHLYLDTSATKWMVRELSKHSRTDLLQFLTTWRGRVLFGSDIVTTEEHLEPSPDAIGMDHLASSEQEAFELYASRYWALRTLWETDYTGESPIVDPDLHMVDPERYAPDAAPRLEGKSLPDETLGLLYHGAADRLWATWSRSETPGVIETAIKAR